MEGGRGERRGDGEEGSVGEGGGERKGWWRWKHGRFQGLGHGV